MKLLSTVIVDGSVEMTYSDNPDTDKATQLLHFRMPVSVDPSSTLALHHLKALHAVRDALTPEIQAAKRIVDQIS